LEKGISSRDAWQTDFFLLHSYFALMADSYGIFYLFSHLLEVLLAALGKKKMMICL
jgi:hypothetical protein